MPKTQAVINRREAAKNLRRQGKTYSEIREELGSIPKSTLSGWLKDIELTKTQKNRIESKMKTQAHLGRQRGAWTNRNKRVVRLGNIKSLATEDYKLYRTQPMFTTGLVLYLAEGSKKSEVFQFMNSDYNLMQLMINWVISFGKVDFKDLRFRLYIHNVYKHENCEKFWLQKLKFSQEQLLKTVYKPTKRVYKKNPKYHGCMRLEVSGSELYWKAMAWRDCLYNELQ